MSEKNSSKKRGLSRRDFLKLTGTASVGAAFAGIAGHSSLVNALAPNRQDTIILKTAGWPFPEPMPTAEEIEADPTKQVYADILQAWLDEHPGVTIERIEFNIWDQQTLLTGLAGGVAPTAFHTTVLGNYQMSNTRTAFAQGLVADVTEYYNSLDIESKIAPYVEAQMGKWILDGRYYGLPTGFNPGVGFIYRKDLIAEAGLEEPTPEWTWADLKALAKGLTTADRKGVALQSWALSWVLQTEGINHDPVLGATTVIPNPEGGWNWRYDFTSQADRVAEVISFFREMVFTDESVFIDAANDDNIVFSAILDGRVAMAPLHPGFLRRAGPGSPDQVAQDLGKTFEEVWGWIQHPRGNSGRVGITVPYLDAISFSPDATDAELEAAVSLYEYFFLGEGATRQQQALYESTGELKRVWGEYPTLTGSTSYEGIEGGPIEAWGEGVIVNFEAAALTPYPPEEWQFFPTETNPAPALVSWGDFISRMSLEPNIGDIATELAGVQETMNAEAQAFFSSVPDDAFVQSARDYFAAQETYLQENSPDFYANIWKPWYDTTIAPILE